MTICKHEGCKKIASYNINGLMARTCKEHKTDNMVNVKNKKCSCGTRPSYNFPGETAGICCVECKRPGMEDVVHKKCSCGTQPKFNFPGRTVGICCKKCQEPGMVDVVNKKCPGYNISCPVGYRLSPGCQYCLSCDPDESRREKFKKYENAFFRHVEGKINVHRREFIVKYDSHETSKKWARLDGIVFDDSIIVCLEVDENGHEDYECDESRMHMVTAELLKEYPNTNVCWVRVNPTTKHKNPWGVAAKEVRTQRFDAVIDAVNDVLQNKTTGIVHIGFD
jgi:hypothetical protein